MAAKIADYERRSLELWASIDDYSEEEFLAKIEELVAALPSASALAAFERACAFDSTGHPDRAVPLYRRALELGLEGERRHRSVIQLASSLRDLGQAAESLELLEAERRQPSDNLDDAVSAVYALALADVGREREAVSILLAARAAPPALPAIDGELRAAARSRRVSAPPSSFDWRNGGRVRLHAGRALSSAASGHYIERDEGDGDDRCSDGDYSDRGGSDDHALVLPGLYSTKRYAASSTARARARVTEPPAVQHAQADSAEAHGRRGRRCRARRRVPARPADGELGQPLAHVPAAPAPYHALRAAVGRN